jgi:hypothetical protein
VKLAFKTKDLLAKVGKNWQRQQEQTNKLQDLGKKMEASPKKPVIGKPS